MTFVVGVCVSFSFMRVQTCHIWCSSFCPYFSNLNVKTFLRGRMLSSSPSDQVVYMCLLQQTAGVFVQCATWMCSCWCHALISCSVSDVIDNMYSVWYHNSRVFSTNLCMSLPNADGWLGLSQRFSWDLVIDKVNCDNQQVTRMCIVYYLETEVMMVIIMMLVVMMKWHIRRTSSCQTVILW